MNIELSDPRTVRITWPSYDARTEAEIVKRLGSVPGAQGRGRRYYCPAIQIARLTDLFPRASYEYAALVAGEAAARAFATNLAYLGVTLVNDESGAVCGLGDNVSPLLRELIRERSDVLRPWVGRLPVRCKAAVAVAPVAGAGDGGGELSEEERKLGVWLRGVQNAAKREAEEKVKYPKRRPRRKAKAAVNA